ncbi:hypothetical protein B0T49_20785 [Chromobacterium violaceum]|nr:hypothetical protein B0T49_20785 [Chromobacterium violaceum]OQS47475.1 hypothetical protein B0T48_12390 [Chromobacterium violaceum]
MPKEITSIIAPYIKAGAILKPGGKHSILILPNKRRTGIPRTIGDQRAIHNLRSKLKRLHAFE